MSKSKSSKRASAQTSAANVTKTSRKSRKSDASSVEQTTAGNVVEQTSDTSVELIDERASESASETANPDTSADASVTSDDERASVEQSSDSAVEQSSADTSETSASDDVPSLDDITSADASAAAVVAAKSAAKRKTTTSAPVVKRSAQNVHRAIVGCDDLWTARLLYRSKRRMRLASVDVSQFPAAFQAVSVADDASDEQRASADAQNARAKTWDSAMLDVITESKYLMTNKTPAIVAFLSEMNYDATTTTVKRSALAASKKAAKSSGKSTASVATAQQLGEAQASALVESLGAKRAATQLQKMRAKIDSDKDASDYAQRCAVNDAAQAYVERVIAAKAA